MTTYQTPGVYVEEVQSAVVPIAGVGTSTAGFIGVVAEDVRMPLLPTSAAGGPRYPKAKSYQPVLVDSFEAFKNSFGTIQPGNRTLAVAVQGFFANGGRLCWVVGVPAQTPGEKVEPLRQKVEAERERLRLEKERLDKLDKSSDDYKTAQPKYEADAKAFTEKTEPEYTTALAGLLKLDPAKLEPGPIDALKADGPDLPVVRALRALDVIEDISIIVVPGAGKDIQEKVLADCGRPERLDRFAILDGKRQPAQVTTTDILDGLQSNDYGAIYFPWIKTRWVEERWAVGAMEPSYETVTDFFPPSGHLAGLYARVDGTRGVHKAPANELIRGALDLEYLVSKNLQAGLNVGGVNVIRKFGNNITVWGARTISAKADWKYVTSRRVFIYLRESIEAGTQWVVFEPNGPELWSKIRMNVRAFLTMAWQDGALFGNTPDEAFYVRCDEHTNPQLVRDAGQVVTEIGVALVKPAEFVIFRMSQQPGAGQ